MGAGNGSRYQPSGPVTDSGHLCEKDCHICRIRISSAMIWPEQNQIYRDKWNEIAGISTKVEIEEVIARETVGDQCISTSL